MMLTNYDLHDIYWSIVLMRSDSSEHDRAVVSAIKCTVDAEQEDNTIESNKIRNILSEIKELKNFEKWQWIYTQNVYTYGIKIIKDEFAYQILSDILGELLTCLNEPNGQQAYDLKDAIHNVPIILAEENKHMKKNIAREILPYRNKWNKCFLKKLIK